MPTASGGFEQTYHAQAGVDVDTHLLLEQHLTQHPNDQQEVAPAVAKLQALIKNSPAFRFAPCGYGP